MTKKLYIKTYGCQMNEYDSARLRDLLIDALGDNGLVDHWEFFAYALAQSKHPRAEEFVKREIERDATYLKSELEECLTGT